MPGSEGHDSEDTQGECYFCGSREDIQTHHILPQRFQGGDGVSNLVELCHDCHWKLERLYNKDFWNALGIDDPRSSVEGHTVCERAKCQEPAVAQYHISASTGSGLAWYCVEHSDEIDEEIERASRSDVVTTKYAKAKDLRD